MRVADRSTARNYLKYLNKAKSDYAATNERIASGNRFDQMSEDVAAGTRVMRTRQEQYKTETHLSNVQSINEELSSAETALTSINDILNDLLGTKLVKALSDTTGEDGRRAIADEIKAMRTEILQFANSRYSNHYLFGGTNMVGEPFTVGEDGRLCYNGIPVDSIQEENGYYYYMKDGEKTNIPMDGDVYMDIGLGIKIHTGWTDPNTGEPISPNVVPDSGFLISYSGLEIMGFGESNGLSNNIYNLLTDIENSLRDFDREKVEMYQTQLTEAAGDFRSHLTDIGARTNFLDTMEDRLTKTVDSYTKRISNLMGVDDAEEATNLTMNDYVLKAVLQMGSRILPVSLMDFLG